MLDDAETVSLRSDPGEAPATRRGAAQELSDLPGERPSAREKERRPPRRRLVRSILFLLLPIALIVGGYWYVTGGQVMSTDDAYVEADKVGISTDVSGIVGEIHVTGNQHVGARPGPLRPHDSPFPPAPP